MTTNIKPNSTARRPGSKQTRPSSVERAFRILEEVGSSNRPFGLSFTDVKRELGWRDTIPSGTLSNLLRTLNRLGYLQFDEKTRLHSLGFRLINLGEMADKRLRGQARDEKCVELLKRVVEKTNCGAHIAVLEGGEALYLMREEAAGFFGARISPGQTQIPHFTAIGKALICWFDDNQLKEILHLHRNPKNVTQNSLTSLKRLKPNLKTIRDRGYAIDDEEHQLDVQCVAAPIYAGPRKVIASIGISTKKESSSLEKLSKIGEEILKSAAEEAASTPGIINALKRHYAIRNNHRNR